MADKPNNQQQQQDPNAGSGNGNEQGQDDVTTLRAELEKANTLAEQRYIALQETRLRTIVERLAGKLDFHDPADALVLATNAGLIDYDAFQEGSDGNLVFEDKTIEKALKDLAKNKPHLVKGGKPKEDADPDAEQPAEGKDKDKTKDKQEASTTTPPPNAEQGEKLLTKKELDNLSPKDFDRLWKEGIIEKSLAALAAEAK